MTLIQLICHPDSQVGSIDFTKEENFSFWKNLALVLIFFTVAPITLGVSLFSLYSLDKTVPIISESISGVRVYASLPGGVFPSISSEFETGDARVEIVRQYLENYNSVLAPYAGIIVKTADTYGLDHRLIPAIAQQESNLCKIIPPSSYNCWGWGIHSKGSLGFNSYEEGIETVSKGLKEEYLDKGYNTVEEIMSKYTPMSNGSWANGVNQFMAEME